MREKIEEISEFNDQRVCVKALLGFKYNCLMLKGARLLAHKHQKKYLTMALDALKYNTLLNRIKRKFVQFRE